MDKATNIAFNSTLTNVARTVTLARPSADNCVTIRNVVYLNFKHD